MARMPTRTWLHGALGAALLLAAAGAGALPAAISTDPPADAAHPAAMETLAIPSGGVAINGMIYLAAGAGPHPTLVICHGWPGNEKNIDLAQAVRRAGWNTVTFNYRGSWGSGGTFRFAQNPDDAGAVLAYLRDPANAVRLRVDPRRIAIAGHSMGGWVTALAAARDPAVIGAATISLGDMGLVGTLPRDRLLKESASNGNGLATSPEAMADELAKNSAANSILLAAPGLARMPVLVLSSDDGLEAHSDALTKAIRAAGGKRVTSWHVPTDHAWSDRRILLEAVIIEWLEGLAPQ